MTALPKPGRLLGIGLGPGDPELITVKALALLQGAPVVAYFAKRGRRGHARTIADRWMRAGQVELPLVYPVTVEIPVADPAYNAALSAFYTEAAARLADHLLGGRDVALLCEGDPYFYGSYMHLHIRLRERFETVVCPGVTGMSGCWTAAGTPMTWGDDVLTVLPGTLPADALVAKLRETDAAVIMKLGSNFPKVRAALLATGLGERALYVERGTMAEERIMPLAEKRDDAAPYFAMILVPGDGRRP